MANFQSFFFDGVDEYIDFGDVFNPTTEMTVMVWCDFQGTASTQNGTILGKQGSGPTDLSYNFASDQATDNIRFLVSGDGSTVAFRDMATNFYVNGGIHTYAGVFTGGTTSLDVYLDSVLDNGTLTGTVPSAINVSPAFVGVGHNPSIPAQVDYIHGSFMQILAWDDALTAAQIVKAHTCGLNNPLSIPGVPRISFGCRGQSATYPTVTNLGTGGTGTMTNMESNDIFTDEYDNPFCAAASAGTASQIATLHSMGGK